MAKTTTKKKSSKKVTSTKAVATKAAPVKSTVKKSTAKKTAKKKSPVKKPVARVATQAHTPVHADTQKKNYFVLALIVAVIVGLFALTMVKLGL